MLPMDPLSTTSRDDLRTRAIDVLAGLPVGKRDYHRVRLTSEASGKTSADLAAKKLVLQGTALHLIIDPTVPNSGEKSSYPGVTEFVLELPSNKEKVVPPQPIVMPGGNEDHERMADTEPRGVSALEIGSGEGADAEGDAVEDADTALRTLEAAVGAASGGASLKFNASSESMMDGAMQLERLDPAVDLIKEHRYRGPYVWFLVIRGLRLNAFPPDGTREPADVTYTFSLEVPKTLTDEELLKYWSTHGAALPDEHRDSPYADFEKGLRAGLQETFYDAPGAAQKCALKFDVTGAGIRYVKEGRMGAKAMSGGEFEDTLKEKWTKWVREKLATTPKMKHTDLATAWARETDPGVNPENKEHKLTFYSASERCRQSSHVVSPANYFVMPWSESEAAKQPLTVGVTMVQCLTDGCNDDAEVPGQSATRAITDTVTIAYASSKAVVDAIAADEINEYNKMIPPMAALQPKEQDDPSYWFAGARGLNVFSGDYNVKEEKRNTATRPFVAMCLGARAQRVAPTRLHAHAAMRHLEHALLLRRERRLNARHVTEASAYSVHACAQAKLATQTATKCWGGPAP